MRKKRRSREFKNNSQVIDIEVARKQRLEKRQAEKSSYRGIETILEALHKAKMRLNANVNFDLVIELLLLTIKEN